MQQLNEAQWRAVTEGDGPTLVLAGAGTGKTRVIVERLAYLASERGIDPRHLLAVTFTNRAANEMRTRVAERLNVGKVGAWVGTFHSFGLYVLRRDIEALGRPKSFTIFDDADQLSVMKRQVKELPPKFAQVSPRDALGWVSGLKQSLKTPADVDIATAEEETYRELWSRYHAALHRVSGVDFDDLLVLTARLLREHAAIRERYAYRYRYVHVDEYQDTNRAQYWIAKYLSGNHGNLFVVGDEDQSIYSWRGAELGNILDFEKDYPGAKVIRLEENYRSTPQILSVSNAVVAHNIERLGKTLRTSCPPGPPVRFYQARDGEDEATFVVEEIATSGVAPKDVAILFRTNGQSRLIEEALRRHSMNYKLVGGTAFYERKEVKDLIAYLRLLVNPVDDVSLRRILNVPARGIGSVSLERYEEYAQERNMPLLQVLRETEHDQTIPTRTRASTAEFVRIIDDFTLEATRMPLAGLVDTLMERTGYREFVRQSDEKDYRTRLEVLDEYVSSCGEADARSEGGLQAFLQDMALVSGVDTWQDEEPGVTLMTIHSAKGLEFDNIFLIGLEEGLLPHASALESDEELEEERRLCYVAMTRARRRLTLSAARTRTMYGERRDAALSRFVGEIPRNALEWHTPDAPGPAKTIAKPGAAKGDAEKIRLGVKVRHAMFGPGVVMYTRGSGANLRAHIRFDSGRTREIMVSHAPLEILEGKGK
ncbi:MAG: UvrD-helicase domain-containing protein [FCB group bacterium]|jgi:DNA helicase-2/ATP-dependent DNA helicase PcrA|nr:UvrD-helicase domain-containing protein [FCB group bacterium]